MDVKPIAYNGLKGAVGMFLKDLEAIPDAAFNETFGDKTRTVADIVFEVNMVNDHVGFALRGEKGFDWPEDEGWIKAPEDFRTKQTVIEAFQKSTDKVLATIEAFSEADMEETVQTEHGDRTRFQRCQFMTLHLWYHSGQLNFIQTLLGDSGWNWK